MTTKLHRRRVFFRFHGLSDQSSLLLAFIAILSGTPASAQQAGQGSPAAAQRQAHMVAIDADGSNRRVLFTLEKYDRMGSPKFSSDGKLIAFDAFNERGGQKGSNSQVIVTNSDGTNVRELGDGAMPTFSPRATRIAFSRYSPNNGVWVMRADGSEKQLLDSRGWCAQWSPNGRMISFTRYNQGGATIGVYDLVEDEYFELFAGQQSPFQQIYWNYCWSPDSRHICAKARVKGKEIYQVVTMNVLGKTKVNVLYTGSTGALFAWHPTRQQVIFPMYSLERKATQLFTLGTSAAGTPKLLVGQDPARLNAGGVWSPDGSMFVYTSLDPVPRKPTPKKTPATN